VATALAVGDTARALSAQARVAGTLPVGSPERRRVLSERLELQALVAPPDSIRGGLDAFRREFPDAPELDELASAVAFSLLARGHGEAASEILDLVSGPRSSLERAYLHLEQGDLESGMESLQEALAALTPSSATEVIQLVSLLGRVSPEAARALGRSAVLAHRGSVRQAADRLEEEIPRLPAADRSAVLAQAARLADSMGDAARGAGLRFRLVENYPDAPEMADAALSLARWRARSGQVPAAIALLEWLIVQRPNSPVVPDARRELDRIKGRGLEFAE
jgi:tetratricopeptide (TPR) repeat protein